MTKNHVKLQSGRDVIISADNDEEAAYEAFDEAALNDPDIPAAVKGEANAPEISDAIWAELDSVPEGKLGVT